jgi:acetyltransferase-like isoleucine patch superfamily enzyme
MRKALKPGIYNINSSQARLWPVLSSIAALLLRQPVYSLISHFSIFSIPAFKLLGLKTNGSVLIGSCLISDPWFTEIGFDTVIADNSSLLGHLLEGNRLILGKIKIGNHSIIGYGSTILPRVEIGSETIIGAHSLVLKNVKIPNKEVWAGIPARKIRKIL